MKEMNKTLSLEEIKNIKGKCNIFTDFEFMETILHTYNNYEILKYVLENGGDPNCKTIMGNTPLHYRRSPEIVKLFLKYGADPNIKNSYDNTAVYKQTDRESVKILIEYGANLNCKNVWGKLPREVNKFVGRKWYKGVIGIIGMGAIGMGIYLYCN